MSFLEKIFSKKKKTEQNEPVMVASISDNALSEMYQDILKADNIAFICRQQGVGGIFKITSGGLWINDNIYVNKEDYERALEIYNVYINNQGFEISDSEEQI